MVKKLLVLLLFYSSFTYAETIKTDVLIIGSTPGGVTAAIQCARSKTKTMLIMPGAWLASFPADNNAVIYTNHDIPSGLWGEFHDHVIDFYKNTTGYDAGKAMTLRFESATAAAVLEKMTDTVKNLTVKLHTGFTSVVKDGTGWEVTIIENGQADLIKAKVLVDATENGAIVVKAGATLPPVLDDFRTDNGSLYRTAIAVSDISPDYYVPMRKVVVRDADNLLVVEKILPANKNMQYLPLEMELGQGVGAMAAYISFFKTTAKDLKVRIIQQELLDFKAYLVPFIDVKHDDRYIRAVQQIGATGMLKGKLTRDGLLFMPDSLVNKAEVEPVLTETYSRAFLWFNKEKPAARFTVGNTLSLISEMTLSEPQTLQITMKNDWQERFHFNSAFDAERAITRMEFAVLINQYLNPFARIIDLAGNMVN